MRIRNTDTFTSFFKDKKVIKKLQNSRNQGFSNYFCLMTEGSGAGTGSGSVHVTNGSGCGSREAQNIQILMRIRIPKTGFRKDFLLGRRKPPSVEIRNFFI
jgi:hypothetical protein